MPERSGNLRLVRIGRRSRRRDLRVPAISLPRALGFEGDLVASSARNGSFSRRRLPAVWPRRPTNCWLSIRTCHSTTHLINASSPPTPNSGRLASVVQLPVRLSFAHNRRAPTELPTSRTGISSHEEDLSRDQCEADPLVEARRGCVASHPPDCRSATALSAQLAMQ